MGDRAAAKGVKGVGDTIPEPEPSGQPQDDALWWRKHGVVARCGQESIDQKVTWIAGRCHAIDDAVSTVSGRVTFRPSSMNVLPIFESGPRPNTTRTM